MNTSKYSLLCCLLIALFACTTTKPLPREDTFEAHAKLQHLIDQEGEISGPFLDEYFAYLSSRLVKNVPEETKPPEHLTLVLINSDSVFAATPGSGLIAISKGLIKRLQVEGELAFIVAHELSHQILGHRTNQANSSSRKDWELRADSQALGLIALAGYDPRIAERALIRASDSRLLWEQIPEGNEYPSLEERLNSIRSLIADSHWSPPGTIDRRDFQLLRKSLTY